MTILGSLSLFPGAVEKEGRLKYSQRTEKVSFRSWNC